MTASSVHVVIAVPPGTRRPGPLAAAVRQHHPEWTVHAVWAGDPQLRPAPAPDVDWLDSHVDEADLVRAVPDGLGLVAALGVARDLSGPVVVLQCGTAVCGDLSSLLPDDGELVVVPRSLAPSSGGDLHPDLADLVDAGSVTPSVLALGAGTDDAAGWIVRELTRGDDTPAGRVLELAAQQFDTRRCTDERIGASVWRWPDQPPSLIDLPNFDHDRPWLADPTLAGPPRISLARADRAGQVAAVSDQLDGGVEPLRLPGGIDIDDVVRRLARRHDPLPARPWADSTRFRRWLRDEYWDELYRSRDDIARAYPHHRGRQAEEFRRWKRRAVTDGTVPLLLDDDEPVERNTVVRTGDRTDGVNLVGYFKHQSGVANVGRRVASILTRHGVPFTTVAHDRTMNPPIVPPPVTDQELAFAHSLVFVNGDEFVFLPDDMPELFGPGREAVGMWSWELETIEGAKPVHTSHVTQIWGTTAFMADPFRHLDVPVEHVRVPFEMPVSSGRTRTSFAPLADAGDRFVFGVVLDHLSVTARKNPLGAIEAFIRAFPDPDPTGPVLLVKTINGAICWAEHERLRAAAAGRHDIVIWDALLPLADHYALMESFDALVSLHRSEGVGLHLAEAMLLGLPVIATDYSGNLDFMDAGSAVLIDASMVPVGPGLWPYPAHALWADPDLDAAAEAMRRLSDDPALVESIGAAARRKIEAMPGDEVFLDQLRRLLRLDI